MKISVVTAVFNNRETIADALDSVLAQRDADVEIIVIDGGSTDGTLDILNRYSGRISHLVSEPDSGIYDALNKGIRLASGDVVGFLHSDDTYSGDRVLALVAAAFAGGNADGVYGDLEYVAKSDPGHVIRYWRAGNYSRRRLRWGWMPPHPTFFVRREAYRQLGEFDTTFRIAADYDMILRFFQRGLSVAYIPEVLVRMRMGGASNRSLGNILRKSREDLQAIRSNRVGGLSTLICKNFSKLGQFLPRITRC